MTLNRSKENVNKMMPHRPFGIKYNKPNLPPTVPIIGLGCSSFSNFFNEDDDPSSSSPMTPKQLRPTDARVKQWIDTIQYAIVDCGITLLDTAPWYFVRPRKGPCRNDLEQEYTSMGWS